MTSLLSINGDCAPGFEGVEEAFRANFAEGLEVGAGFAVVLGGEVLVDLRGGHRDTDRREPIAPADLFPLFSTTKGLVATCIAMLVERGALDYEQRVAHYWPEFAAHGKDRLTLGQMISHQAGLCGLRETTSFADFYSHEPVASRLASQQPFFAPGEAWGYHPITYGTLLEEIVRRTDGRTLSRFFAEEIAGPTGLDIFIGLPDADLHRQVPMIAADPGDRLTFDSPNPDARHAANENPPLNADLPNSVAWRRAGLAGAGGSGNALALARLYGGLAQGGDFNGVRLLSPSMVARAAAERMAGIDQSGGSFGRYAAGFRLNHGHMGASPSAFGHGGWGGSLAFADPDRGVAMAYIMNKARETDWSMPDPRSFSLIKATYRALAKLA